MRERRGRRRGGLTVFPALSRPRKRSLAPKVKGKETESGQSFLARRWLVVIRESGAYSCLRDLGSGWNVIRCNVIAGGQRSEWSAWSFSFTQLAFLLKATALSCAKRLLTERGQYVPEPVLYPVERRGSIPFRQL